MGKKFIFIAAPPASGKTFVADRIAKEIGNVAYFDKDTLYPLVNCAFETSGEKFDMDSGFYRERIRPAEYQTLLALAEEALRYENCVIVNAPFGKEIRDTVWMRALRKRLNDKGCALFVIWILSTPERCLARMRIRNAQRDARKLADWLSYAAKINFSPPEELVQADAVDRLILFNNADETALADSLREVLSVLNRS